MAYKIVWTDSALSDLETIAAYISKDSPQYAAFTVEKIILSVERLSDFPQSGRVVPEYGDNTFREIIWKNFRITYRVSSEVVYIVGAVYAGRLMDPNQR